MEKRKREGGDPQFRPKLKNYWPLLVSGGRGDSFLQEYCPWPVDLSPAEDHTSKKCVAELVILKDFS